MKSRVFDVLALLACGYTICLVAHGLSPWYWLLGALAVPVAIILERH